MLFCASIRHNQRRPRGRFAEPHEILQAAGDPRNRVNHATAFSRRLLPARVLARQLIRVLASYHDELLRELFRDVCKLLYARSDRYRGRISLQSAEVDDK